MPDNETNGNITYYVVCYKVTSAKDICSKTKTVEDVVNRNTTLNNLNEFTTYDVAIKAGTSVGAGPEGGIKSETTLQDCK